MWDCRMKQKVITFIISILILSILASSKPYVLSEQAYNGAHKPLYIQYTVVQSDTLSTIAQVLYGDENKWTTLWNDNQWIKRPETITAGQVLLVRKTPPKQVENLVPILASKTMVKP